MRPKNKNNYVFYQKTNSKKKESVGGIKEASAAITQQLGRPSRSSAQYTVVNN